MCLTMNAPWALQPTIAPTASIHAASHALISPNCTTADCTTALPQIKKINTAKNLQMLLELHCAHDHWNFEDVASLYGLTLPDPRPECWACLLAKPRRIAHDKVSTRQTTRVFEGFAADAKGPISTPTPEGFRYFFLVVCLFSSYHWTILAQSQDEWKDIWPAFVKRAEAKSGKGHCVSFIITDGHKVHSSKSITAFNEDRGIQPITAAPHSQWQDPAERGIQTVMNGARTSLIHGGGKEWMWGWAVLHSGDSTNRMKPPHVVPGHEDKSRLRIMDSSMTPSKEMRTHKPFLCPSRSGAPTSTLARRPASIFATTAPRRRMPCSPSPTSTSPGPSKSGSSTRPSLCVLPATSRTSSTLFCGPLSRTTSTPLSMVPPTSSAASASQVRPTTPLRWWSLHQLWCVRPSCLLCFPARTGRAPAAIARPSRGSRALPPSMQLSPNLTPLCRRIHLTSWLPVRRATGPMP